MTLVSQTLVNLDCTDPDLDLPEGLTPQQAVAVFALLEKLRDAYNRTASEASLEIYLHNLLDIPAPLLERAVGEHIRECTFYPTVAELRQRAARIAGTKRFDSLLSPQADSLAARALALEDAFCLEGRLDESRWLALASAFRAAGREHRAARCLERLAIYRSQASENKQ